MDYLLIVNKFGVFRFDSGRLNLFFQPVRRRHGFDNHGLPVYRNNRRLDVTNKLNLSARRFQSGSSLCVPCECDKSWAGCKTLLPLIFLVPALDPPSPWVASAPIVVYGSMALGLFSRLSPG